MNIILGEMRKLWTLKMALILIILIGLFYQIFMSFNVEFFCNGHPDTEMFAFSTEMTQTYGNRLDSEDVREFVRQKREVLIPELESLIQSTPLFAAAGVYDYEDYQVFREKAMMKWNKAENELMAWLTNGKKSNFIDYKLYALLNIEEQYNKITSTGASTGALDWFVLDRTNDYLMHLAILAVLCVIVFVSPILVTDRMRGVMLLQYTSKQGRKMLSRQLAAVIISTFLLVTLILLAAAAIYRHIGIQTFFGNSINSFLAFQHHVIDMNFGQYILVQIGQIYLISMSTALFAFILSRFSSNFVTLLLKLVPSFVVLTMLCVGVLLAIFADESPLYIITGFAGIWLTVCCTVMIIALTVVLYVVRREKKIDII